MNIYENYGVKNYLKEDHRSYRLRLQKEIPYQPEVFSDFLFAAAKVASISAMIFFPGLLAQLVRTLYRFARSKVRIPYKPEFFTGFLFATANGASKLR